MSRREQEIRRWVPSLGLSSPSWHFPVPFVIEALKRPRLEIVLVRWMTHGPFPFTFASAGIRNKPLPRLLNKVLSRDVAQSCEVFIDYFKWENPQ
jgi:hypothetical protein